MALKALSGSTQRANLTRKPIILIRGMDSGKAEKKERSIKRAAQIIANTDGSNHVPALVEAICMAESILFTQNTPARRGKRRLKIKQAVNVLTNPCGPNTLESREAGPFFKSYRTASNNPPDCAPNRAVLRRTRLCQAVHRRGAVVLQAAR